MASSDKPLTSDVHDAVRKLAQGVVGIGVSPELLAEIAHNLFIDVWENEVHLHLNLLDNALKSRFKAGIERRIKKLLAD